MNKILRILDANFNRAREGLRVVEDGVRFILDDGALTRKVKKVRHALSRKYAGLFCGVTALAARDSEHDAGREYDTAAKTGAGDIIVRNLMRSSEALRCLEEYGKSLKPEAAVAFHDLRFDVYRLEKEIRAALAAASSLDNRRKTNYHSGTVGCGLRSVDCGVTHRKTKKTTHGKR
jgi:thiamine-phosphate pyrophosphorylase